MLRPHSGPASVGTLLYIIVFFTRHITSTTLDNRIRSYYLL